MTTFHFLPYTYRFEIKFMCYGLQISSSPIDISREIIGVFSSNDVYLAKEEILSKWVVKYQRRVPTLSETYPCPFMRLPRLYASLVCTVVFPMRIYESRPRAAMNWWALCTCLSVHHSTNCLKNESPIDPCILEATFPSVIWLSVWKIFMNVKEAGIVSFLNAPITVSHNNLFSYVFFKLARVLTNFWTSFSLK